MTVLNLKKLAVVVGVSASAIASLGIAESAKALQVAPACYNDAGTLVLPAIGCEYVSPDLYHLYFNGIIIQDVRHYGFTNVMINDDESNLKNIGDVQTETFDSLLDFTVNINGKEQRLEGVYARTKTQITLTDLQDLGDGSVQKTFTNEMLSLDIQGLPKGILLREIPTISSIGQTIATPQKDGRVKIDSYFDIFAEISLDGGATWTTSEAPARMTAIQGNIGLASTPEPSATVPLALVGVGALWSLKRKQN